MKKKAKVDLAALLVGAVAHYKEGRHQECIDAIHSYILQRQDRPEPQVKIDGREWGGDHIASSYNRAALVARDGPAYRNYN